MAKAEDAATCVTGETCSCLAQQRKPLGPDADEAAKVGVAQVSAMAGATKMNRGLGQGAYAATSTKRERGVNLRRRSGVSNFPRSFKKSATQRL